MCWRACRVSSSSRARALTASSASERSGLSRAMTSFASGSSRSRSVPGQKVCGMRRVADVEVHPAAGGQHPSAHDQVPDEHRTRQRKRSRSKGQRGTPTPSCEQPRRHQHDQGNSHRPREHRRSEKQSCGEETRGGLGPDTRPCKSDQQRCQERTVACDCALTNGQRVHGEEDAGDHADRRTAHQPVRQLTEQHGSNSSDANLANLHEHRRVERHTRPAASASG